jgi:hypothetical protein
MRAIAQVSLRGTVSVGGAASMQAVAGMLAPPANYDNVVTLGAGKANLSVAKIAAMGLMGVRRLETQRVRTHAAGAATAHTPLRALRFARLPLTTTLSNTRGLRPPSPLACRACS